MFKRISSRNAAAKHKIMLLVILKTWVAKITSFFRTLNDFYTCENSTLHIGVDFSSMAINILALQFLPRRDKKGKSQHKVCFLKTLTNDKKQLINTINDIKTDYLGQKLTLTLSAELEHVLTKVVSINTKLSDTEIERFLQQKVSRVQRFKDNSFALSYVKLNNEHSENVGRANYYLAVCDKALVDNRYDIGARVCADDKKLDLNSLAYLRVLACSKYQTALDQELSVCCHLTEQGMILLYVVKGTIEFEKFYKFSIDAEADNHFYTQALKIASQVAIKMQINETFHLFMSSFSITQPELQFRLVDYPALSLAQITPIKINLSNQCKNINNQKFVPSNKGAD